ncbi:hypothetical protein M8J75_005108 [Diaphorina citri]|nr:hypothetical protein M8J75_005108 [Diaphorina citri]
MASRHDILRQVQLEIVPEHLHHVTETLLLVFSSTTIGLRCAADEKTISSAILFHGLQPLLQVGVPPIQLSHLLAHVGDAV